MLVTNRKILEVGQSLIYDTNKLQSYDLNSKFHYEEEVQFLELSSMNVFDS